MILYIWYMWIAITLATILYVAIGIVFSLFILFMYTVFGSKYPYTKKKVIYLHFLVIVLWLPVLVSIINDNRKFS